MALMASLRVCESVTLPLISVICEVSSLPSLGTEREIPMTFKPCLMSSLAIPAPMPLDTPVITTTGCSAEDITIFDDKPNTILQMIDCTKLTKAQKNLLVFLQPKKAKFGLGLAERQSIIIMCVSLFIALVRVYKKYRTVPAPFKADPKKELEPV